MVATYKEIPRSDILKQKYYEIFNPVLFEQGLKEYVDYKFYSIDQETSDIIYKQYFETVNKYLFCLTHNNDISEELTQETFYKAVKKIDTYKGECKISVWLCQIAKHIWYDYCKKNKKVIQVEEELLKTREEDTTEQKVISNDEKMLLYKKMQALDEKTREVIYLRITGELSFKEIGIILNKTENWARVTFYRGKNQLKEVD